METRKLAQGKEEGNEIEFALEAEQITLDADKYLIKDISGEESTLPQPYSILHDS